MYRWTLDRVDLPEILIENFYGDCVTENTTQLSMPQVVSAEDVNEVAVPRQAEINAAPGVDGSRAIPLDQENSG